MPENIYLESKEKLFKYYPSFLVKEKTKSLFFYQKRKDF